MKSNKTIVLNKLKTLDNSKLHFVHTDYFKDSPYEDQSDVEYEVEKLKTHTTIESRVVEIMCLCEDFATFDENNKFQCRAGANRSAGDIWRIYNNYFRPVSLFTIMRTLYKLVIEDKDLFTLYCMDIRKLVFNLGDDTELDDTFNLNELGVRFAEWRTIGL